MVVSYTITCSTSGSSVPANTAVSLTDQMTGAPAYIPQGSAVRKIDVYRDGDTTVTTGCGIQLGITGQAAKYIATGDAITTTALNNSHVIHKNPSVDFGVSADSTLYLTLDAALNTGSLMFEITYASYS